MEEYLDTLLCGYKEDKRTEILYTILVTSVFMLMACFYLLAESKRKKNWIKQPRKTSAQYDQTYCYLSLDMVSWSQVLLIVIIILIFLQFWLFYKYSEILWKIWTLTYMFTQIIGKIIVYI